MSRYAESRFLPGSFEIHWLSIINSFVLVLLLTAFLTIILLRVLKNDFSRYMELDDDAMEEEEVRIGHANKAGVATTKFTRLFLTQLYSTVWLETHSWGCISVSASSRCILRGCWDGKPVDCRHLFPSMSGFDWHHLDDPSRIHLGRCGCSLLLDVLCCGLHSCSSLQTNEREELDSMHIADCWIVPNPCCWSFYVGQLGCDRSWIYQCASLYSHLDGGGNVYFLGVPVDGGWRDRGEELC